MKWYDGQIPGAIAKAKQQRSIFLVYIGGEDDQSKTMEETWLDESVTKICEDENMVALRIPANSETCKQFSAIYPVFIVPCTFFIGENGTPLEVTAGSLPADKFVENIQKALKLHKEQQGMAAQSSTPSMSADSPAPSAPPAAEPASATSPSAAPPPLDDRVQKAKELVAKKQQEKREKEKEEEKKKERERRQLGQDMHRLKAMQAEMEAKELREQIKKDRDEEKQARQRIVDQIARDREERAAKYKKEKQDRETVKQERVEAKVAATAAEEAAKLAARLEHARIQFRLPDGSAITQQFSSSDTLETAHAYLQQQIGNRLGAVQLSVTYPKRNFTEEDMSQTLRSLGLAPAAAIIVVPGRRSFRASSTPSGDSNQGMFAMLFAPFLAIWNFLMTFLFGTPPSRQVAPPPSTTEPSSEGASAGGARPKSSQGVRNRQPATKRLHNLSDDDDDKATWNGNSTQQL